ncbi:MAG: lipocalin family protein [Bacteroidota bacterium]
MKRLIFSLIVLAALFTACETPLSKSELISTDPWKLSGVSTTDGDQDLAELLEAVLSIATLSYDAGGTYSFAFPDSTFEDINGTWNFNSDETQITLSEPGEEDLVYTILTLTEETLSYSFTDSTGTYTETYIH